MITEWITALCQEPWCFSLEQVSRLTDWQIVTLYLEPAIERSKQFEESRNAPAQPRAIGERPTRQPVEANTGPPGEPGSPEHRSACLRAFMDVQGLNRDRAVAQYERQLAQWRMEQQQQGT